MGDNLIQYSYFWRKEPIILNDDEIVLLGTISRYTTKSGYLKTNDPQTARNIFRHNNYVVSLAMPNLSKNN